MNFKKLVLISGFTITFLLLITPLFLFGNNFFETYTHSILNLKIISKYNFNPFIAYYDLMGPGISLPLGFNLLYFPTSLIINNYILYFFSTIFLCLCIQFYFLRRLLLFLNLNYQYLIFFIFTFSASSLHYIYNTDYLDKIMECRISSLSVSPGSLAHVKTYFASMSPIDEISREGGTEQNH